MLSCFMAMLVGGLELYFCFLLIAHDFFLASCARINHLHFIIIILTPIFDLIRIIFMIVHLQIFIIMVIVS